MPRTTAMAALPGNLDGTRVLDLTREPGFSAGNPLADPGAHVVTVGPRAGWRGSDLTVTAMSGNLYSTGDPDRAPVRCSLPVSYYHGGIEAALGVAFALLARERTGEGQHVDVALQEAMVMPNIGTAAMCKMTGNRGARAGAFMRQEKSVAREI